MDLTHPAETRPVEDLTPDERHAVQETISDRYLGRLDREAWSTQFRREGGLVRLRIYGTDRKRRTRTGVTP